MNRIVIESTFEANIFWLSLIVADLIWAAFFLISFFTFSFKWMVMKTQPSLHKPEETSIYCDFF